MILPGKRTVPQLKRMILCILCVLAALFLAVGCDLINIKPSGDGGDTPDPTPKPEPTEPEPEPDPDPEPVYYTVTFKNAKTQNASTLLTMKVKEGDALSEEQIDDLKEVTYHGYTFVGWYTYPTAVKLAFDPTAKITEDTTVYGDRGKLAGEKITWEYDAVSCKLTFTGEGEMFSFLYREDVPWFNSRKYIQSVEIDPRIKTLANYAFYECTALKKITLPEGIVTIGKGAFKESAIRDVNFPSTLTRICEAAFDECRSLEMLNLNAGLKNIENYAFANCVNIHTIVFTDSVLNCDTSAFLNDNALTAAYYIGTKEAFGKIKVAVENFWLFDLANIYFISEEKPTQRGPYWYYDADGNIRQWYYTVSFYAKNSSNRDYAKLPFLNDYVDVETGMDAENVSFYEKISYHGYRFAYWKSSQKSGRYDDYKAGTKLDGDLRLYGERGNLCGDSLTYSIEGDTLIIEGTGRMWDFEGYTDAPWYAINNNYTKSIRIGSDVTYIGKNAFSDMIELVSFHIPTSVTGISEQFIVGCRKLLYIYYDGTRTELEGVTGAGTAPISVETPYEIYFYTRFTEDDKGTDGNYYLEIPDPGRPERTAVAVAWSVAGNVLTVGGDATMPNFNAFADTPWVYLADSVTELCLRENIHIFGHHTFDGMSKVEKITLPSSENKYYTTVQNYRISATAFAGTAYYNDAKNYTADGALYIGRFLIRVDAAKVGSLFLLLDGTEAIAQDAFADCGEKIRELVFYASADAGLYTDVLSGLTNLTHFYYYTAAGNTTKLPETVQKALPDSVKSKVAFLRVNKPAETDEGIFWYFDESGKPQLW